ncbi:hypothetical protein CAPTEDRAFT_190027 [Capitella teleta]|uniref:G-protein coupled receptors family 1 profile domain-containing protein n=1 Tax=Capitella teleta TaxID=283909 RepID=R7UZV9_CAPTE|nr:hypothetical protein CAPTEDRAFT_190027 [Capitella teleta]|eukprot:ELU11792.1 hypothetical protein CAPTEDRAFT_190027 [Capitella teleta]
MAPIDTYNGPVGTNTSYDELANVPRYSENGQEYYTPEEMEQMMNEAFTDSTAFYVVNAMCLYVPPVLVIISTVCNILVLVLLLKRKMPIKNSSCFYMVLIVVVHCLYLYVDCALTWISRITQTTHLANQTDWMCKVWAFLSATLEHACSWIIVLYAGDRIIFIWFPLKTSSFCTVFSAKLQTIAMFVGLGVTCIHNMWTYQIIPGQGCMIDPTQEDFETLAWPWVLATVCSYVPLLISMLFTLGLSMGICCFKCTHNTSTEVQHDRYTRLSLVLCILLLLFALPKVIINLRYYFTGNQSGHYYLFIDVLKLGQNIYMAFTFVPYLLTVPQLRVDLCLLCSSNLDIVESEEIEVAAGQAQRNTENATETDCHKTSLLLSVRTTGQGAQESTYL